MERGLADAAVQAGELYFLKHPTAEDTFSGYGLTLRPGRTNHLAGLLMVDRPAPVDRRWLAEVEEIFGGYSLVPMTAGGVRGIACQMHVDPQSLPLLRQRDDATAAKIRNALSPLLENPPDPAFDVRWDEQRRLWTSQAWIGLPWELQQVFDRSGYGCFSAETEDGVSFVTHASDEDIETFRGAPVLYNWELIEMPSAPLIRFHAVIIDDVLAPYGLEHFVNIEDPNQARCLQLLVDQDQIAFDFFGEDYEYVYSKHLAHDEEMRRGLQGLMDRAKEYWSALPEGEQDFDRAKAQFQRRFPV